MNYVLGDSITVTFKQRQIYDVQVHGHAGGFYVQLATDTAKAAPKDSTAKKPAPKKPAETKKP